MCSNTGRITARRDERWRQCHLPIGARNEVLSSSELSLQVCMRHYECLISWAKYAQRSYLTTRHSELHLREGWLGVLTPRSPALRTRRKQRPSSTATCIARELLQAPVRATGALTQTTKSLHGL